MALTLAKPSPSADTVFGNKKVKVRDVTFDASYPTGGESLVPSDVDLNHIDFVLGNVAASATEAVAVAYDHTNETLMAFETGATVSTPLDEVGNTEDLSAFTARLIIVGHS